MGFHSKQQLKRFADVDLLHRMGCKLCPLYNSNANTKDMKPSGSTKPDVLILGQGPGKVEDQKGEPFVGPSGDFLREAFTEAQWNKTRRNNITRTRTPGDREPTFEEVECCRPSVENDIKLYPPKAIFAFGGPALNWFLAQQTAPSINAWRGHRFPVVIGGQLLWVFPMLHPAGILRAAPHMKPVFQLDIINAYKFLARNIEPTIVDPAHIFDNCHDVYTLQDVRKGLVRLSKEPRIAVDIETTPGRPYEKGAKIWSISIGTKDYTIAFPWKHPQAKWTPEEFQILQKLVLTFLLNKKQAKIAHNAAFEIEWLVEEFNCLELALAGWVDTMSAAYNLGYGGNVKASPTGGQERLFKGLLSLDSLCRVYLGFFLKAYSNVDRTNLGRTPIKDVLIYNAGDSKFTHWLDQLLMADIVSEELESIVYEHNRRIPTVVLMQRKGLYSDEERAKAHASRLETQITKIYNDIHANSDVIEYKSKYSRFNVSTPANIASFFEWKGFNVIKELSGGKKVISSDDEILKAIDHPVSKQVVEYRELSKLKSTYVDIFIRDSKDTIVYPDGLVHGEFSTHFTTTGRLSSHNPNLQNFPKRRNKEIRDIIIAPTGYVMVSCDYGQIEYRQLVMSSKDKKLIEYVWAGRDVHAEWALNLAKAYPKRVGGQAVVNKWADADLSSLKKQDKLFAQFRDIVKNGWVFAAFYGAGVKKLSATMTLPESVVKSLLKEFWDEFAGVKQWHEWAYQFYANNGYIESLTKRRRYAFIEAGQIINTGIQGAAFDIVMDAMNRITEYALETKQLFYIPVVNIHDDITFYLPKETWKENLGFIIRTALTCPYDFVNVPLSIEASVGPDWYHQEPVGTFTSDKLDAIMIG